MQNPDKPFKTYDEQVSILKSRNVYIKNEEIVKQCLTDISYYSLINGYKDLFDSDINGKFSYPVPFTDFYFLYNFDRDINSILLKYIIMVERALKSNITYQISEKYGVYTDLSDMDLKNADDYLCKYNYKSRARINLLRQIKNSVNTTKNECVIHYQKNHNHIPFWVLINSISYGLTIKLYSILQTDDKEYVSNNLIKSKILSIEEKKEFLSKGLAITKQYRNKIAHGNKIFLNNIKEELPKNQVLKISRGYITDTDYKNGIGKNDICAVILFIIVVLNSDISDIFLIELKNCLQIYDQIVFSPGRTIYDILGIPQDFIQRLLAIKSTLV